MQRIPSTIVPIDSITEAPFNYNTHPDEQIAHLDKSLSMFGQFKNIIVHHGKCIAGNGLLRAAKQRGETEVEIKDFSHLSDAEAKALLIADNATPALSYPDVSGLEALLDDIGEIEIPGCTEEWLAEIRGHDSLTDDEDGSGKGKGEDKETPYSRKIVPPIYEITGEQPDVTELVNTKKSDTLIAKIQASSLPEEEKTFLIRAAYRHDVFHFGKIAEYYAHVNKETQEHFEDSVLVIIDIQRAIEDGYSVLAKEIEAQFCEDYPDD